MKKYCPYCTKEISGDALYCPACAAAFGEETLLLAQGFVEDALKGFEEVQRRYDRLPKKYRVSYSSAEAFTKSYLLNIGKGGIFIKTTKPLKKGEKISLNILLPDGAKELQVTGEVMWSSEKKHRTRMGEYPPGMGVKFVDLAAEDKERIDRVLRRSTP